MSKKYNRMHKTFASVGEPLYDHEDFLYYFENREKSLIREELQTLFHNLFYSAPF